jgi:LPPG:FO 2-phospho-L-lactate transferase
VTAAGSRRIAVVSGGVGAARFLRGLTSAIDDRLVAGVASPEAVTAVVNTGDDCTMHGLAISPDLDTVVYTLAGAIDPERGWGLVDESWRAMESLDRYVEFRAAGSAAGDRWFNLGDRDLATHLYRTGRLGEGASLTTVTDEIRRAWGVPIGIVPMTDDRLRTMLRIAEDGTEATEIPFQDYFVRLRHGVPVRSIRFEGDARLTERARQSLAGDDVVVIAPSNPLVSIGPIRALDGVDELLAGRRESVVAVSPIVGGAALKGPADRMLTELGHEASVVGVAELYAPIASVLVVDPLDADLAADVEARGMRCVVQPSVMSTPERSRALAAATIAAVTSG